MQAEMPDWLKYRLAKARERLNGGYYSAGYHLGRYHNYDFVPTADLLDLRQDDLETKPTNVLRRILNSGDYPNFLIGYIPPDRHREFVDGILKALNMPEELTAKNPWIREYRGGESWTLYVRGKKRDFDFFSAN